MRWSRHASAVIAAAALVSGGGCAHPSEGREARSLAAARASGSVARSAAVSSDAVEVAPLAMPEAAAAAASGPAPITLEAPITPTKVKVRFDKPVLVVPGDTPLPIIYLHGRCGDPTAFGPWANVAKKFGTLISLTGDSTCKHGTRTQWGLDTAGLDRRVTRAIEAIHDALGIELDASRRIVIGYSQGSLRAEALATMFPERYPRAMLIGGPRGPRETSLSKSEAVLIMVGDHDLRDHLREAAKKLEKRAIRVRYQELKGARHGEYGDDAPAAMQDAFAWLTASHG